MNKLLFLLKRPKVIFVLGAGSGTTRHAILRVLEGHFRIGKDVIVCDDEAKDASFMLKNSNLPILVSTHVGEYHPEKEFFVGNLNDIRESKKLVSLLPGHAYLILNFDDETVRDLKNQSRAHSITFGLGMRSDIRATDILLTQFPALGTNFKINYDGNIVPCWLENLFGKENIYAALAVVAVGQVLGLNLVEVSEALKNYKGLAGKMRLIEGIKKSYILDDSENASPLSMSESLITLKKIEGVALPAGRQGRKIAVLGDILGIGRYAIEAHEAIGRDIKNSVDLLFTVGERAKFFGQGAKSSGMSEENIFQFDDAVSAAKTLQNKIKEGDLILIDGSKEMSMIDIVKEIKAGPIV